MDLDYTQEIPIDDPSQVVLHKEMFMDITNVSKDIKFSHDFVDFAFAETGRISESKQVVVENKYPFSIDVSWALLNVYNPTTGQWVKNPFKMRPDNAQIAPGTTMTFNAEFAPHEPDQYFFQTA